MQEQGYHRKIENQLSKKNTDVLILKSELETVDAYNNYRRMICDSSSRYMRCRADVRIHRLSRFACKVIDKVALYTTRNPPQDPKFYRRFDVALKQIISAVIIGVTYLIIKPSLVYEIGYLWRVVSIVGCIVVAMIVSRYLPLFLYGYAMINKH